MAALQDPDGSVQIPYLATGFDTILERDLPPGYCIEEPRLSFRRRARHIRSIGSKKQGPDPITQ